MPTIAFTTLGCKVNQSDTEEMAQRFMAAGYEMRDFDDPADVYVVNTCTVTHVGDQKSRQMLGQARRRNPWALVVATGCYAQVAGAEVARVPGVDLVVGNTDKTVVVDRILDALQRREAGQAPEAGLPPGPLWDRQRGFIPLTPVQQRQALPPVNVLRTRAQIKVQDGCNNFCTFCIVPLARGVQRSIPIETVVAAVRQRVNAGVQEVVLTGVHLGGYGNDGAAIAEPVGGDLGDLIAAVLARTDIPRLRISSVEPQDFQVAWLDLWRDPRLCPHLHLPLQSGSPNVLRRMARRYTLEKYRAIVETARAVSPEMFIATDLITGFPGETEAEFAENYRFVAEMNFAAHHIFRYSRRQGTAAARLPEQVPSTTRKDRAATLAALDAVNRRRFHERLLGRALEVLFEEGHDGWWEGWTRNYVRARVPSDERLYNQRRLVELRELVDGEELVVEGQLATVNGQQLSR